MASCEWVALQAHPPDGCTAGTPQEPVLPGSYSMWTSGAQSEPPFAPPHNSADAHAQNLLCCAHSSRLMSVHTCHQRTMHTTPSHNQLYPSSKAWQQTLRQRTTHAFPCQRQFMPHSLWDVVLHSAAYPLSRPSACFPPSLFHCAACSP